MKKTWPIISILFFTSIAQKVIADSSENFLKSQNEMSFFIQTVDIRGTENVVSGLQENKASGRNGLLIKILKTLKIKLYP